MRERMRGCVTGRQRNILSRPKVRRQRSKPTYGGNGELLHPDSLTETTWQVRMTFGIGSCVRYGPDSCTCQLCKWFEPMRMAARPITTKIQSRHYFLALRVHLEHCFESAVL